MTQLKMKCRCGLPHQFKLSKNIIISRCPVCRDTNVVHWDSYFFAFVSCRKLVINVVIKKSTLHFLLKMENFLLRRKAHKFLVGGYENCTHPIKYGYRSLNYGTTESF